MICLGLGLYKMALGLLGKKSKAWPCLLFLLYHHAATWAEVFLLDSQGALQEGLFSLLFFPAVNAIVLALILKKSCRMPFLQTLTAAVLGNFIIYTIHNVTSAACIAYSPVFDGKYLYAFTTICIPYMSAPLAAMLISYILRKSNFYRYFSHLLSKKGQAFLTLMVGFVLLSAWPLIDRLYPGAEPGAGYAVFFFSLIVIALFWIQFLAMYTASQDRILAQEETIAQQQAHMELLEELQQEIRAFRHDVTNLFSGISLQAQEGDLAGIQEFMRQTGTYFDKKLGNEIQQMDGLNNLWPYPVRSLLTTKLAAMRKRHVQAVLEVLRPVNDTQAMETDDLLRGLGILLDNATEAAASKNGLIRIVLLQEEKELYIAVANNYDQMPDLSALSKKGYTTKGSGHGTGLTSYQKILSRYPGCASRTYLKDDFFVQELHVPTVQKTA